MNKQLQNFYKRFDKRMAQERRARIIRRFWREVGKPFLSWAAGVVFMLAFLWLLCAMAYTSNYFN